jgi:hypothetical protein
MRSFSLIAVVLLVSSLAAPARASKAGVCVPDSDLDLSIGGCIAVICSGQYPGRDLAVAYYNRGLAYRRLDDAARTIEDDNEALRIQASAKAARTYSSMSGRLRTRRSVCVFAMTRRAARCFRLSMLVWRRSVWKKSTITISPLRFRNNL